MLSYYAYRWVNFLSLVFVPQSNLQAEMEAEQQICHTKKRALQIATDELAKNHETIKQQEKTVVKLKKGVEWRSLVMMRMSEGIKLN